jgi:hypothetical protein
VGGASFPVWADDHSAAYRQADWLRRRAGAEAEARLGRITIDTDMPRIDDPGLPAAQIGRLLDASRSLRAVLASAWAMLTGGRAGNLIITSMLLA